MQYIIASGYFNWNVFLQCDLAVSGEAIQVARIILSGKNASGEMLLQLPNFWGSATRLFNKLIEQYKISLNVRHFIFFEITTIILIQFS